MMKQLTNFLAALCLSLMACTQIQGMNRNVAVYPQELCIIQQLLNQTTDPDRLGPITIEPITANDRFNISMFTKHDLAKRMRYLRNRVLMAKAACQPALLPRLMLPKFLFNIAMQYQDGPVVDIFLKNRIIDPNMTLPNNVPPLFQSQSVKMTQLLISYGASFTTVERTRYNTILHHACWTHSAELLEYYLQHTGINVNTPRNYYDLRTPLHVWADNALRSSIPIASNLPLVQKKLALLIAAGADCAQKDAQGKTALTILSTSITEHDAGSAYWHDIVTALSILKTSLIAAMSPQIPVAPIPIENNSPTQDSSMDQDINDCSQDLQDSVSDQNVDQGCSLCLDTIPFRFNLACNHEFCQACILKVWEIENFCPVCRFESIE